MGRRVALLLATSGHSGVDRVVKNLVPELGRTPHQYDLLLIRRHGPYLDEVPDNVTVHHLPSGSKNTVLPGLLWYLFRNRPDVLMSANHKLNRAALMARSLTGIPGRVVIRMGMSISAQADTLSPRRRKAWFASMRRWYPRADAVIAPSRGVGNDLEQIAGVASGRLQVIPNPVINDRFHALASEPVSHPWYEKADCPVVLGVGSLEPRKDFTTLIRAFARVRAERRCRLLILGEGRQRGALLELASRLGIGEDVELPGFDENPYRYMRQSALFVLASRREGASAVIVEALACGTPVVSTDCPSGPAETLQNGRYGRLVPIGDPPRMAQAIAATLDDPPPAETLRQSVIRNRVESSARAYLEALGAGAES